MWDGLSPYRAWGRWPLEDLAALGLAPTELTSLGSQGSHAGGLIWFFLAREKPVDSSLGIRVYLS